MDETMHARHPQADQHYGHDGQKAHDHGAHDSGAHAGHDPALFRRRFWLTLVLTIPTLVFSPGRGSLAASTSRRPSALPSSSTAASSSSVELCKNCGAVSPG